MSNEEADDERQLREAIALSLAEPAQPPALTEEDELKQAMALSLQAPPAPATATLMDEDAEMQAALALSLGQPPSAPPPPAAPLEESSGPEPEPTAEALAQLVFGADATPTVLRQWHSQGFRLGAAADGTAVGEGAAVEGAAAGGVLPFGAGLEQEHGGPCAVLSAAQAPPATTNPPPEPGPKPSPRPSPSPNLNRNSSPNRNSSLTPDPNPIPSQAFLLRRLLFDPDPARPTPQPAWRTEAPAAQLRPPAALAAEALLSGLADILWGAALGGHATADTAAPPKPGGASCTVALLPPEMLPFEGTAAELQACLLRGLAYPLPPPPP